MRLFFLIALVLNDRTKVGRFFKKKCGIRMRIPHFILVWISELDGRYFFMWWCIYHIFYEGRRSLSLEIFEDFVDGFSCFCRDGRAGFLCGLVDLEKVFERFAGVAVE